MKCTYFAGNKGVKKKLHKKNLPIGRGLQLRDKGTYTKDKPPIVAMISRNAGKVIFKVVPNLSRN
jgi:hypothetical protein